MDMTIRYTSFSEKSLLLMQKLLFSNTFFEDEFTAPQNSILSHLTRHFIPLQLHYLSCLLCDQESPLLALAPEEGYYDHLKKQGLTPPPYTLLEERAQIQTTLFSWGPSSGLSLWAKKTNCLYDIPKLSLVQKIQSKEFCFLHTPRPQGSMQITDESELRSWWSSTLGPKVLKTLYGSSGRGHFVSYKDGEIDQAAAFFHRNHNISSSYIAEPWVDRELDFSTQWFLSLDGSISYLGVTLCENSQRGIYKKSIVGPEKLLFPKHHSFLQEHLAHAQVLLKKIQSLGFFGPIGLDSFIYRSLNGSLHLLPIVEINARRTMGWAALKMQEKLYPNALCSLQYSTKKQEGSHFLPDFALHSNGYKIPL